MGKVSKLIIVESEAELFKLKKKQSDLRSEKRIECLLLLKSSRFTTQEMTADYLGISRQTIVRWITAYNRGGIAGILPKKTRAKKSKIFTPEIHKGLAEKMSDSGNPILGYWDAQPLGVGKLWRTGELPLAQAIPYQTLQDQAQGAKEKSYT